MKVNISLRHAVRSLHLPLFLTLSLTPIALHAQDPPPPVMVPPPPADAVVKVVPALVAMDLAPAPRIEVHAELQNLFLFRNDTDFDRTTPFYNENGQAAGAFATVFKPSATFHVTRNLRMYYELELGLNYWSRNNPDEENALASDVFVMKHREVWAEGELWDGRFGFKAGYQRFRDPTGLFLDHWIGAASAWVSWCPCARIGLFAGEIPDQTYEGLTVRENNFKRDIMVFGGRGDFKLAKSLRLSTAVTGLYDNHVVGRTRWVVAPSVHLEGGKDWLSGSLDGVFQYGSTEGSALGGGNQKRLAWAVQGHATATVKPFLVDVNVLALSPDDDHDGNRTDGSFMASAKNRSATMLLTEDEMRDWYDNLDERMSAYNGGFFAGRAGFLVGDVKATWAGLAWFRPSLVVGAAAVLNPENALGNSFVGVEADCLLEFRASEHLWATVGGGGLFPGKAASALVNAIDRTAASPIWSGEASLTVRY